MILRLDPSLVIYLARHGQTEFNRENRFCGQTDSPLTREGIDEAHRNGRALREHLGDRGALRLVSSPLARALETAGIIRSELGRSGLPIETDRRLREISFGAWEGLTVDEIKARYADDWQRRVADKWNHAPPGGESYAMLARRVGTWLGEAQGAQLVVTHGAVDRIVRGLYAGLSTADICALPEPQDELFHLEGGRITTL
jgi:broad specificity phosphatase PhoE